MPPYEAAHISRCLSTCQHFRLRILPLHKRVGSSKFNLPATEASLSSLLLYSLCLCSLIRLPICVGTPHHSSPCYLSITKPSLHMEPVITPTSPFLRTPMPRVTRLSVCTAPVALPQISAQRMAIVLGVLDTCIEAGVRTSLGSRQTALKSVEMVRSWHTPKTNIYF